MIELSLPQIGESAENVKDRVVMILAEEYPLTLMQLYKKIRGAYSLSITYQAVRKAVDLMVSKGIIDKEERKYKINKKWALESKSFFDDLLTRYESGKKHYAFSADLAKENYTIYTFNNLLDLDVFWGDVMLYWADHLKKGEEKEYFSCCHYHWWFVINLGRETKIYDYFRKQGVSSYFLCWRDLPLNKWATKLYKNLNVKAKIVQDLKADENTGINVMGDTVIQVYYDAEILQKIRKFYEKYKDVHDAPAEEIVNLAHTPCEVKFVLFKNKGVADTLKDSYRKRF